MLARRPEVVVDEFAHGNVPGGGRDAKRRQDIDALLGAGIDVVTAVNVQHLASRSQRGDRLAVAAADAHGLGFTLPVALAVAGPLAVLVASGPSSPMPYGGTRTR